MAFPDLVHALRPNPRNNIQEVRRLCRAEPRIQTRVRMHASSSEVKGAICRLQGRTPVHPVAGLAHPGFPVKLPGVVPHVDVDAGRAGDPYRLPPHGGYDLSEAQFQEQPAHHGHWMLARTDLLNMHRSNASKAFQIRPSCWCLVGYGVNTFKFVSSEGKETLVKVRRDGQ